MICSMLCWGSWAATFKSSKKWRYELYYFDFSMGAVIASLAIALTLGTLGFDGFSFLDDIRHAGLRQDLWAMVSGGVFNLANMLLLAAISIAGMAVALPIGLGVALVTGVIWNYANNPTGNKAMMFGGTAIVMGAIIVDALAYRSYALQRSRQAAREGRARQVRRSMSTKGIVVSVAGGALLAVVFPLLTNATSSDIGLGPYSTSFFFALGIFFTTFVFNLVLMNLPLEGAPLEITEYFRGNLKNHGLGILGGMIWVSGLIAYLAASAAEGPAKVGPPYQFGIVQGAPIVAALLAMFLFGEFSGGGSRTRTLVWGMLFLFLAGLALISMAPMY